jgi:hypothetical protein
VHCSKIDIDNSNENVKVYERAASSLLQCIRWEFASFMHEQTGNSPLSPGAFVRHPDRPDWGLGQIQSMVGSRITVNFENAGKLLIDGKLIELEPVELPRR